MQNVLDFSTFDFTTKLLRDLAATSGSRVLFSFGATPEADSGKRHAEYLDSLCEGGLDISAVTQPRGSGFIFGLQSMLPVAGKSWGELRRKDFAGRLAAVQDPDFRHRLIEDAKVATRFADPAQVYWMGDDDTPVYTGSADQSLKAVAEAAGEHFAETFLRISLDSQGKALFTFRMFNMNIDALRDLLASDRMFPILGDAGAHVSQIMDAGWASFVLAHWVREEGLFSIGDAIRRMTSGPARIIGLSDRGTLAPGMRADVNVLDPDIVAECQPEIVHDFPGGAPRFIQRSKGYKATLVNGQINVVDGQHTGVRAGEVLRHRA
jgi:N-acyl-D-aspartate/D-glutamate deacylase